MNTLQRIQRLLDTEKSKIQIASVIQVKSDNTCVVKDDNGQETIATGSSTIGKKVLIINGTIQSEVPTLPTASFYV